MEGREFVHGPVVNERIDELRRRAATHGLAFRRQFVGGVVELLVENDGARRDDPGHLPHGRCERYFDVHFDAPGARPGDFARVRVDAVTPARTHGTLLSLESRGEGVA